jgi:hypothetical protein
MLQWNGNLSFFHSIRMLLCICILSKECKVGDGGSFQCYIGMEICRFFIALECFCAFVSYQRNAKLVMEGAFECYIGMEICRFFIALECFCALYLVKGMQSW